MIECVFEIEKFGKKFFKFVDLNKIKNFFFILLSIDDSFDRCVERCCATGCCPVSDIDASDQTPNTMNLATFESKNVTIGLIVGIFGFVILALMLICVFCRIRKPTYRQMVPKSSASETFSNKTYLTDV